EKLTGKDIPKFATTTAEKWGDYGYYHASRTGSDVNNNKLSDQQKTDADQKAAALNDDQKHYFDWFDEVNAKWNKPTHANLKDGEPEITYGEVKTGVMVPVPRKYD
ncbi:MAG: hypothetical protein ACYTDT_13245, partial [Planctomycetota bacterium]